MTFYSTDFHRMKIVMAKTVLKGPRRTESRGERVGEKYEKYKNHSKAKLKRGEKRRKL